MPNGTIHDLLTYASGVALGGATFALSGDLALTLAGVASHLLSGLWFSPGLDVECSAYYRWGPLRFIWRPYRWLVPHRSVWSHGLVIGPALRLLYVAVPSFLGLWLLVVGLIGPAQWGVFWGVLGTIPWPLWAMAAFGFVLGGAVHTGLDQLGTAVAKRRKA